MNCSNLEERQFFDQGQSPLKSRISNPQVCAGQQ